MDAKTQQQYAETFHGLHRKGDPLVLFNAWDVATAKAIAKTSPAVATSSGAVASALGYADGEVVPLDMVTDLVSRLTAAVPVPVSIDLEAGYGDTPDAAAKSATEILKAGAIGINIEDGLFGGKRQLVGLNQHAAKIKAVRGAAAAAHIGRRRHRPRWPVAIGGLIVAALASWAILKNDALRTRLADAVGTIRDRISTMKRSMYDQDEIDAPIAFARAETAPIEASAFTVSSTIEPTGYPAGLGSNHGDTNPTVEETSSRVGVGPERVMPRSRSESHVRRHS